MDKTKSFYAILADVLCYPAPGQLQTIEAELADLESGSQKKSLERFLKRIGGLSLGEWEELHTRTLDLNPPAAPYVGFQVWGESYQRGVFLSKMSRASMEAEINIEGELPDHLIPILRYLAHISDPLPELIEIFPQAMERMHVTLRKADPDNPYLEILEAVQEQTKWMNKEAA